MSHVYQWLDCIVGLALGLFVTAGVHARQLVRLARRVVESLRESGAWLLFAVRARWEPWRAQRALRRSLVVALAACADPSCEHCEDGRLALKRHDWGEAARLLADAYDGCRARARGDECPECAAVLHALRLWDDLA